MSLLEAAAGGNRLSTLRVLRDAIAREIDECESGRDMAALTLRFTDILAQISELETKSEKAGDPIDEIARRRAARGAGATSRAVRTERSS